MTDHPMHAETMAMAAEHSLVGGGPTYTVAQGERPLWEFGPVSEPARPLATLPASPQRETDRKEGRSRSGKTRLVRLNSAGRRK